MKYSLNRKMIEERNKFKMYCSCGHSMIMFPFEKKNKKICRYCGNYVYINKQEEFKERLGVLL